MREVVALLLLLPFLLFFMFQPFHNELVHLRGMALEAVLDAGLQKAAVQGHFNEGIINEMKETLRQVGFNTELIEFEGTDIRVYRGEFIEGTIKYPMQHLWAMPGVMKSSSEDEELYYIRYGTQMSEYLER